MKYLLDTNVLSELRKPDCDLKVRAFAGGISNDDLYICALTIGELYYGIVPPGKKKNELLFWLNTSLPEWFNNRIIALDTDIMAEWGKIRAGTDRTMPIVDSLIAAAAISHHMILVTRNVKDFSDFQGLTVINPWDWNK